MSAETSTPNVAMRGLTPEMMDPIKHYFDDLKISIRGEHGGGLIAFGLERIDSDECKNAKCDHSFNVGVAEYRKGKRVGYENPGLIQYGTDITLDGDVKIFPFSLNNFPYRTSSFVDENSHIVKYTNGLYGYLYVHNIKTKKIICTKTWTLEEPKLAK